MSIKALQEYTYYAKYARYSKELKRRETWAEAVERVKEMHLRKYPMVSQEIEWAFDQVKQRRVLGSQRALQYGGEPIERVNARIYNCTTSYCDRMRFFQESLWLLLCGCGVGFSVQRHHIAKLPDFSEQIKVNYSLNGHAPHRTFQIPDSIEGWAEALGVLLATYLPSPGYMEWDGVVVDFDYSLIRPAGAALSSGAGKAPGPAPLRKALEIIRSLLNQRLSEGYTRLRPIDAYDIVMHASDAVISGGVRRSATICIFSLDDQEMATAKTGNWFNENPQRGRSNNSAMLLRSKTTREDFLGLMKSVKEYGEPGFVWADNTEILYNPCCEIGLYPIHDNGESGWAFCNLCEINGKKVKSSHDFEIAAKAAAIIGTLQAGYTNFSYLGKITEEIVRREALLGVSMTGMMDNPEILLDPKMQREMAALVVRTNEEMADKIGINSAARTTCVKPAGCQTSDTMVAASDGILTLGESGDVHGDTWQGTNRSVLTQDGEKASSKFFVNGLAKTKRILMDSGVEIECTTNHQYQVFRDGKMEWVAAERIIEGDVIPYKVGGYEGGVDVRFSPLMKQHTNAKEMRYPDDASLDLCWLIGLYTGDGSNHAKGIRIHGDSRSVGDLERARSIIKAEFDLDSTLVKDHRDSHMGISLVVNSVDLIRWLVLNGLVKSKSTEIDIPLAIRRMKSEKIKSFIDGYWCADGCTHPNNETRSWVTTSKTMAAQMLSVLRFLGQDCSMREMPPSKSSFGRRMRYWIEERKGRKGVYNKSPWRLMYAALDKAGLTAYTPDTVVSVSDSESDTFDIEVSDTHAYLSNGGYVSHNTTSCILGSSSGIHPHHARRYFRRVQANYMESTLRHFKEMNPTAVEKSVWNANGTDEVVTFCVEVPDGARTKNDMSALDLLKQVQSTFKNWVTHGKVLERCVQPWLSHNVSNTINVRENEWDEVADFIFTNRESFSGVSLLPQSGDLDYPQAPFCNVLTAKEILHEYGEGALFASGLIVDGLHSFEGNLWEACDTALGRGKQNPEHTLSVIMDLEKIGTLDNASYNTLHQCLKQIDWIRRVQQFAHRYCGGDIIKCCRLMKHVNNWKMWLDLNRDSRDVDWEALIEEGDTTLNPMSEPACAGGSCELPAGWAERTAGRTPEGFNPEFNCPTHFAVGNPLCPACVSKQPKPLLK